MAFIFVDYCCLYTGPHKASMNSLALGLQLAQQVGAEQAGSSAIWDRPLRARPLQGTAATAL